ncbi:hypothetical protein EWM64_g5248 [Hericium alpestre]|uniref:Uncharacterized protein n=1 Tax=Hericium alpestre TaxID=135208 RepID=A0A4Y9ZX44_9AGAM|nr:hypothetical protein EWM64_g5248 [Hericium alpestre]
MSIVRVLHEWYSSFNAAGPPPPPHHPSSATPRAHAHEPNSFPLPQQR